VPKQEDASLFGQGAYPKDSNAAVGQSETEGADLAERRAASLLENLR
jgi:hypothetical protein